MNNRTRCLRQQISKAQPCTLSLLSHSRLCPFDPNTPSSIIIISQLIKTRFSIFFFFFMFQLRQPTDSIIASLNIRQPQFLSLRYLISECSTSKRSVYQSFDCIRLPVFVSILSERLIPQIHTPTSSSSSSSSPYSSHHLYFQKPPHQLILTLKSLHLQAPSLQSITLAFEYA